MKKAKNIAILGAGIMGSSTALLLADKGQQITLFDAASEMITGASRWNEGKIHLGFLYAADPSMGTARKVLTGGLLFKKYIYELLGFDLERITTHTFDTYLVHRDSVVSVKQSSNYYHKLMQMIHDNEHCDQYFIPLSKSHVKRLSVSELEDIANPEYVVGGFQIPEFSVNTNALAECFIDALVSVPEILFQPNCKVTAVRSVSGQDTGPWFIEAGVDKYGPFDIVVNATWEGRLLLDAQQAMDLPKQCNHRYRLSVFGTSKSNVSFPSAVLTTGPFGDVKNYNGKDVYLSWYPVGLLAEGSSIDPPPLPIVDDAFKRQAIDKIIMHLGEVMPGVTSVIDNFEHVDLKGGWVFAKGEGKLSDRNSTLHQRSAIGIEQQGTYFSVDTGKYSIAPWLAHKLVDTIVQ